jgi:multiple sugar transport system substrate-binding protein
VTKKLNRRDFLKLSAASGAALAVGVQAKPSHASNILRRRESFNIYWNPGHKYDTYQTIIDQFSQDTGFDVNWEQYQWPDMRTKILADFAAGDVPDLVEEPGGWVQEFGLAGNIQSLQPYVDRDGAEMGFPNDWQAYTVSRNSLDSDVYGVQLHLTCNLPFYNKQMLSDAGIDTPPSTWDEFLAACQATTNGRVFGFAPNQNYGYMWTWYLQNGVSYYDPVNNVIPMNNQAAYDALQFVADLVHKYKVAPVPIASADYEGPQKLFSAKRAAMILTGPWDIKPILEGSPDVDWGISQALTGTVRATYAAGTSLMIPTDAKHPDEAWELLKRLTTLDAEVAATAEANMCMPRISWGENPDVQANERIAPFAEGLGYAQDSSAELRLTGKFGEIDALSQKAFEDAIYSNRPAKDALDEFVDKANAILAG